MKYLTNVWNYWHFNIKRRSKILGALLIIIALSVSGSACLGFDRSCKTYKPHMQLSARVVSIKNLNLHADSLSISGINDLNLAEDGQISKIVDKSEDSKEKKIDNSYGYQRGMDLTKPCGLTSEELSKGVKSGTLKKYIPDFLDAEKEYNVNAVFLISVAATESSWGTKPVSRNNIFSIRLGKHYVRYSSVKKCINSAASQLKTNYLIEDGKYYNGKSVSDVNKRYCYEDDRGVITAWGHTVEQIMEQIYKDCE